MKRNNKVVILALFVAVLSQGVWAWKLPGLLSWASSDDKSSEAAAIKEVKGCSFKAYPDTTIGEAFEEFFADPEWDAGTPDDEDLQDSGITLVNFTGGMMYAGKDVDALVQFYVDEDGNVSMHAFEMNGIPQDDDMQDALIEVIFDDD